MLFAMRAGIQQAGVATAMEQESVHGYPPREVVLHGPKGIGAVETPREGRSE